MCASIDTCERARPGLRRTTLPPHGDISLARAAPLTFSWCQINLDLARCHIHIVTHLQTRHLRARLWKHRQAWKKKKKKRSSPWQSKVITGGHSDFNVSSHCADAHDCCVCAECNFHDDTWKKLCKLLTFCLSRVEGEDSVLNKVKTVMCFSYTKTALLRK